MCIRDSEYTALLILGRKFNGSVYSPTDASYLEICAKNISVAIENALKYEEIEQFTQTLQMKVEKATKKLKKVNQKLEEQDAIKDEFISMTSHQLKPQLSASSGFISLLQEGREGQLNKGQSELVELAQRSIERMAEIVTKLLDTSKFNSEGVLLSKKATYLQNIVREEVRRTEKTIANEKNIRIVMNIQENMPKIAIDGTQIEEVISNLLANAVQYSHNNSEIKVSLKQSASAATFTVQDFGIGVAANKQKQLFTKFYRAKNARLMRPTGTGIGLFFARKVITAHGGTMQFTSKLHHGSTVSFKIPLK